MIYDVCIQISFKNFISQIVVVVFHVRDRLVLVYHTAQVHHTIVSTIDLVVL